MIEMENEIRRWREKVERKSSLSPRELGVDGFNPLVELGIGYWAWLGSFGCLAAALWLRDREWDSAKTERVVA